MLLTLVPHFKRTLFLIETQRMMRYPKIEYSIEIFLNKFGYRFFHRCSIFGGCRYRGMVYSETYLEKSPSISRSVVVSNTLSLHGFHWQKEIIKAAMVVLERVVFPEFVFSGRSHCMTCINQSVGGGDKIISVL